MKNKVQDLSVLIGLVFILGTLNIRICPFFHIFHIPCPGCGLTRAFFLILKGNIRGSFKYNLMGFPIIVGFVIYFLFIITKNKKIINNFFNKHKLMIIIIVSIITIINWIVNIKNPYLY